MNVRAIPVLLAAALAAACALGAVSARAETVVINHEVTVEPSTIARPHRGMRMQEVERKFGEPSKRHPTVGKPPITRWDYPQFSVFFEGDRVIHSVVAGDHSPESGASRPALGGGHGSGPTSTSAG